uniref:Uncharacterized protein n=1 Tax=Panagrolaimus sp. ES5 TaxID=591445 RepID=A0AC34FRH3_9BILA
MMGKPKSRNVIKKSREVETTISMDSSLSSNSIPLQRSPSPFSFCFIVCAFVSVALVTAVLTYAVTTTLSKPTETPVQQAELTKIHKFMQNMQNWFVTHNYYKIAPDKNDDDKAMPKCGYQACDFKQHHPTGGWPKLPEFKWEEMNKSPYPIPKHYQPCKSYDEYFNSTTLYAN